MSRQRNTNFSNITATNSKNNNRTQIKDQDIRTVKKIIQKMNENDDEISSKKFLTFSSKKPLGHSGNKHPQLDKYEEHQILSVTNSKYQTDEIQKPIFQNPAVEKYLNESMKKTLKRYKN